MLMTVYVPLSAKYASADGTAARTFGRAAVSVGAPKPRYDGTAIASRMPMMTMTTRSSMRVKPSSRASRSRSVPCSSPLVGWQARPQSRLSPGRRPRPDRATHPTPRSRSRRRGPHPRVHAGCRPSGGADAGELFDRRHAGHDLLEAVVPQRPHALVEGGALDLVRGAFAPRAARGARSSRGAGRRRRGPCSPCWRSGRSRACGGRSIPASGRSSLARGAAPSSSLARRLVRLRAGVAELPDQPLGEHGRARPSRSGTARRPCRAAA